MVNSSKEKRKKKKEKTKNKKQKTKKKKEKRKKGGGLYLVRHILISKQLVHSNF
jgi:hypothetical protein